MAMTNHERVGKALDLLREGLGPFVQREVQGAVKARRLDAHELRDYAEDPVLGEKPIPEWDAAGLLKIMWETWNDAFRKILGPAERSYVGELRGHRNRWAHQENFSGDDAYRALDSASRLLTAVSAPQSEELEKLKMELLRLRFDEQTRGERRKQAGTAIESAAVAATGLKPWRDVVIPHVDVYSGRYQQAEFAADLWQVHLGEGTDEYRDPAEFFRRTYLTESLKGLLTEAVRRLVGEGGDPVVQLQTNFGGGKTHSMLALYHLFSGTAGTAGAAPGEFDGVGEVLQEAGVSEIPTVRRVVLVGTKVSPGNPTTKPDGTVVRTLWGELAWQLGGKEAFACIAADDEKATNPGDALRELFNEYGPCLILIDEWVAYARQLPDEGGLPAGSFDTQFTFAQALTEAARLADRCLLVISLPASDTAAGGDPSSSPAQVDDVEVGGERGKEALERLRNVAGRIDSSWRPASAEESFEIVRRRLFVPFSTQERFKDRDVVARAFAELYRTQHQEFPPECRDADYERRLKVAYPIHPEVFDRLYSDWSTLVKFQRTRGVLRLMAAVIHSLWAKGDKSPLILPANVAIDDPQVQSELTRYLPDTWVPVIETDVDGPGSLPLKLDNKVPNLGRLSAARRVARTVYLGSAPTVGAAHQGLEDRRVKLGCVMPGEQPAVFGDALRRLASDATYLYQDGNRYWYSTQPTVTKLAEDRAEQLRREPDKVAEELARRLRADLRRDGGDFSRVHDLPHSGQDVPDDLDARLVVLRSEHYYGKDKGSPAEVAAKAILESKGTVPRMYRNTLVFLAADGTRLQDLEEAVRSFLAWESILDGREELNLDPYQVKQAEAQREGAAAAVTARLPETYQWLLVPKQDKAEAAAFEWQATRLSGQGALAERASKRLKSDEALVISIAPSRLRMELDRVPLWRQGGDHVSVKQVVEDFAQYLYLPRVREPSVLLDAIGEGVKLLTWEQDAFAFADSFDEDAGRYRGLRGGQAILPPDPNAPGLLVRPEAARRQLDHEGAGRQEGDRVADSGAGEGSGGTATGGGASGQEAGVGPGSPGLTLTPPSKQPQPKRFHGTVPLDPVRVGPDASKIAEEVISHLAGLVGAEVTVTLEIQANIPAGAPERVVRTVTENSRTLKFTTQGFEEE